MNLPEYFAMVLDERGAKYKQVIFYCDLTNPDEKYASEEADFRLKEIEALRKVLKIHNTYRVVHDWPGSTDPCCAGCGLDGMEDLMTPNVNDCPILLALVEPYSDRADFGSWT